MGSIWRLLGVWVLRSVLQFWVRISSFIFSIYYSLCATTNLYSLCFHSNTNLNGTESFDISLKVPWFNIKEAQMFCIVREHWIAEKHTDTCTSTCTESLSHMEAWYNWEKKTPQPTIHKYPLCLKIWVLQTVIYLFSGEGPMEGENLLPVAMAKHIISIKNICLGLLRCPAAQCSARSMGWKKIKTRGSLWKHYNVSRESNTTLIRL